MAERRSFPRPLKLCAADSRRADPVRGLAVGVRRILRRPCSGAAPRLLVHQVAVDGGDERFEPVCGKPSQRGVVVGVLQAQRPERKGVPMQVQARSRVHVDGVGRVVRQDEDAGVLDRPAVAGQRREGREPEIQDRARPPGGGRQPAAAGAPQPVDASPLTRSAAVCCGWASSALSGCATSGGAGSAGSRAAS